MYIQDNKIIYTAEDFEQTVQFFSRYVEKYDIVLFSIYQGSLSLCHRLSKQYNLPHSILKFQKIDGNDTEAKILYDALYDYSFKDIFVVDDIWDTGETMKKCNKFIDDRCIYRTLNNFVIFNNEQSANINYQHLNPDKTWVQFTPWEGNNF